MEAIRLVENSDLPIRRTLDQLGIHRSTFGRWYRAYLEYGYDGLKPRTGRRRHWNRILMPCVIASSRSRLQTQSSHRVSLRAK